jgi:hypothetical protein
MITKKDRITTGCVDYFPNALAAIGRWSAYNNAKYPPDPPSADGSPRWSFDVSTDHADAIGSHLAQRGTVDEETGFSHSVPLAWRSLALLESELVAAGAPPGKAVLRGVPKVAGLQARVDELRHPAEKLAIEAFRTEAHARIQRVADYEPEPAPLHVGQDNDRFAALRSPDLGDE